MSLRVHPSRTGFLMATAVDCPPCGERSLTCECTPEERDETAELLRELCHRWPDLWPTIHAKVEKLLSEYHRRAYLTTTDFKITLGYGAQWCDADWSIALDFLNEDGFWTVFFRDFEVVHAQPSL